MNLSDLGPFEGPLPYWMENALNTLSAAQEWGDATNYDFYPVSSKLDPELGYICCFSHFDNTSHFVPVDKQSRMPFVGLVEDDIRSGNSIDRGCGDLFWSPKLTYEEVLQLSGNCHI